MDYPNSSKAQRDYIFITKKWINCAMNQEAYSSFEGISSDHRIILVRIHLTLHRNKKQTIKASQYDWFSLADNDIYNYYLVTLRNSFYTVVYQNLEWFGFFV